jgi:hypothetical protein
MSQCNCGVKPLELPSTNEKYAPVVPYESNESLRDYSNLFQFIKDSERSIPENNPVYYLFLAIIIILAFMILSYAKKFLK